MPDPISVPEQGRLHAPARSVIADGEAELAQAGGAATVDHAREGFLDHLGHRHSHPVQAQLAQRRIGMQAFDDDEQTRLAKVILFQTQHLEPPLRCAQDGAQRGRRLIGQVQPGQVRLEEVRIPLEQRERGRLPSDRPPTQLDIMREIEQGQIGRLLGYSTE